MSFIKSMFDTIMSSEIMSNIKNLVSSIVETIASSDAKKHVDNFIENNDEAQNENIITASYKRISKLIKNGLVRIGLIKSNKVIDFVSKTLTIASGVSFLALVIYIALKIFPKVIMIIATVFAISLIMEVLFSILSSMIPPKASAKAQQ